jgi:hypothetical protein
MTDESPGVTPDDDALRPLLKRAFTVDELMRASEFRGRFGRQYHYDTSSAEVVLLIAAAASYVTAFTQTLAKRNAEALIERCPHSLPQERQGPRHSGRHGGWFGGNSCHHGWHD